MRGDKTKYREITEGMTNDKVNEILVAQYNYDLFNFSLSLAVAISDFPIFGFWKIWEIRRAKIPGMDVVKEEIEKLTEIRTKIFALTKTLRRHIAKLPDWHRHRGRIRKTYIETFSRVEGENVSIQDKISREFYGLQECLNNVNEELSFLKNNIWEPFKNKPGKSAEPAIVLRSFWALVMRKNRNADMNNIKNLLNWYATKLRTTNYGSKLKYKPADPSIYRFKTEHKHELEEDRRYFFPLSGRNFSQEPRPPKTIQIRFKKETPEIYSITKLHKDKKVPQVVFPDKSTFTIID